MLRVWRSGLDDPGGLDEPAILAVGDEPDLTGYALWATGQVVST